jgi:FixJ family two-component response regulator
MTPYGDDEAGNRRSIGTIAVIDDDSSFREALVAALVSLGYLVADFESPYALLDAVELLLPACLLIDLDLPAMSGLDMYRSVLARGFAIPAIFITANASASIRRKTLQAGAVACLRKPVSMGELDGIILSAVR